MKTADFYYELPEELIAQDPLSDRAASRLLVIDKITEKRTHTDFHHIGNYLNPGDCLVINNTKVIPARLIGERENTGGKVELLLLKRKENNIWETLVKPGKKARIGSRIVFGGGILKAEVVDIIEEGNRLVKFEFDGIFEEILDKLGQMPLPPYITHQLKDKNMYQTVYAKYEGSAAIFSCAEDIAVLCAALQNGGEWNGRRILSPLGVKNMRTVPRATASLGRTLGWDCFTAYASNNGDLFGPNTYSHTGYTGTSIVIDPDNDTSVILLINAVHPEDGHSVVRLRSLVANAVAASICPVPHIYTDHYYKRFLQFMDEPAITSKDIVMLGNSLTEGGGDWSARLGKKNVRNRGIIGDEVMGIYDRLHQILPGHPAKLFLLIGVNDISHNLTSDSIVSMIRTTVERIQKESPDTKLYLQSLLPFNESFGRYKSLTGKTDIIPEVNLRLEALAKEKNIAYINLFPLFTEKGTNVLRSELTNDGLHLNEDGYKIWVKAIKKKI